MDERVWLTWTMLLLLCGTTTVATADDFDYTDYAGLLNEYLDETSMVDYKNLKAHRSGLDSFTEKLARLDPKTYEKWTDRQKIAFWLNAYNALTLKAVIDNYPIKHSWLKSLTYPKNSIRQIDGVWTKIKFDVMGKPLTLGHIEHKILRKKFAEPRIHMAMVCAAMGCPTLRNEPYIAEKLDEQLDDQTAKFLANREKCRIDNEKAILYISPILKWFADDFVILYPEEKTYRGHGNPDASVIRFIDRHLDEKRSALRKEDSRTLKINYLKYDWSLNEQPGKKKGSK